MATTTADAALERLRDGNQRFTSESTTAEGRDGSRRRELAGGQSPFAILLSCADSRVAPEIAFDAGLGELFVVRVAGNIADTAAVASIEYAVANLGAKLIVVMAHRSCGAVAAAVAGVEPTPALTDLLSRIRPAITDEHGDEPEVDAVAKANARLQAERLVSSSDVIGQAVASGNDEDCVRIVTAFYDIESGEVSFE